jgi:hypothetical protein
VQAIVAKPDQFFYYTSPVTFPASAGLLLNDVLPGSCTTPTFAVVTPPTSGSVVVRSIAKRLRTHNCPMAALHWRFLVAACNASNAAVLQ